jgi:L-tyrosine isonitrile synthase
LRARAVEVVRRSDAWSRLVDGAFPDALRLSIHPQPRGSSKLGIHVMDGDRGDAWLTPWHGVAVLRAGRFALMRRVDAEALGAHVVIHDGRPSHMEIS